MFFVTPNLIGNPEGKRGEAYQRGVALPTSGIPNQVQNDKMTRSGFQAGASHNPK